MQQVQLTFNQLAEAALELGATPNAIRVWRQRGIPHRYQVKLMQHFNGALKIIDWSPDGDAIATIARCDCPVDHPARAAFRPCVGCVRNREAAAGEESAMTHRMAKILAV
jgi:hypothetical protein